MASDAPPPPASPSPPPPPPPAPDASRADWHVWRHQQRDYARAQWRQRYWYGPSWMWFGRGWFWGAVLVVLGLFFLLSNLGYLWWLRGDIFWPVVLILLGVWLLVGRSRWWR